MSTDVKKEPPSDDEGQDKVFVKVEWKMEDGESEIGAITSNLGVELKVEPFSVFSPELPRKQDSEIPFEVELLKIEEIYIKQEPKFDSYEEGAQKNDEANCPENQENKEIHKNRVEPSEENKAETKKYKCKKCHRQFNWKTNLRKHTCVSKRRKNIITELYERIYTCDICKKQFVQKKSLQNHIVSHAESEDVRKPHKCSLCERQFSQIFHLNDHMKMHTGEKLHTCQFCSKQFIQLSNLKGHLRIHTGEKPYPCDRCGKSFTHKATLTGHLRIHLGIRPYRCELCDKNFTQKSHLNTHNNIIHRPNKKTYNCSHCGKVFFSKISLTDHLRIHKPKKPFPCDICPKQYSRKSCLVKHLRSHPDWEDSQKLKAFTCKICMKQFTQKCSLDRHNSRLHNESKKPTK